MSESTDNKEMPAGAKKEEPAVDETREEQEEATTGPEKNKMAPPADKAAGAASANGGDQKNVSGSDAIKAAVKAGNINIHQEEREEEAFTFVFWLD